jgi:hypothetical protein
MGVMHGNLKTIVKGSGRYHETRWNVSHTRGKRPNYVVVTLAVLAVLLYSLVGGICEGDARSAAHRRSRERRGLHRMTWRSRLEMLGMARPPF